LAPALAAGDVTKGLFVRLEGDVAEDAELPFFSIPGMMLGENGKEKLLCGKVTFGGLGV
jgi:hypothetical protein